MKNPLVQFLIAFILCCLYFQVDGQLINTSGVRVNEYNNPGNSEKSGIKAEANTQGFKTIVWLDSRNDKNALFAQVMDEENKMINSNFQVSGDLEEVTNGEYDVDISNDNKTIIVWEAIDEVKSQINIYYQMYDQDGIKVFDKKIVTPERAGISAGESPAVAFLDNGSFVIAMQKLSYETFDDNVFIQKFDPLGDPVSDQIVIYEYDGLRRSVDIVANSDRILTLFGKDGFGETNDILYSTLDTSLNILIPPTQIQANNSEDQFSPQADKFPDQSFIVSWIDKSGNPAGEVKVQRFDKDGVITGSSKSLGVSNRRFFPKNKPFIETLDNEFMIPLSTTWDTWKIYNQSLNQIASGMYSGSNGAPTIDRNGFGIFYVNNVMPPTPSIVLKGVRDTNVEIEVNDDTLASDQFPVVIDVNIKGDAVIAFTGSGSTNSLFTYQLVNSKMELIGSNRTITSPGSVGFVDVAMANDGSFALMWKQIDGNPPASYHSKAYIQFFDNAGQAITDTIRLYHFFGGTTSGFAHGLVYNPTSNRYLAITEPSKNGNEYLTVSIFNKSGQSTKPSFDLVEVGFFPKVQVELTPSGEFIISYFTSINGAPSGERKYYYSKLSSTGDVLEKNKLVFPETNTVDDHYSLQINNTTYFIWRSNQDSVGPDKINEPIMIRGLTEQGNLGNIHYLDVPGELFSVLHHYEGLKIFTEDNDKILVTNFKEGDTGYQTIPFISMKEYTQDEFEWVAEDGKMHVAYQTFVEKGRGLDVVYDILEDQDEDGFFEQTDCNDSLSNINPLAMEIPNNDIDENCDGLAEQEDLDGDGYFANEDCNDMDSLVNPGQMEIPYNGKDDDCDSLTYDDDLDRDGFPLAEDCNDNDPDINPDAMEIPNNGIDEDCDGMDSTTNVSQHLSDHVTLFPNPAQDVINIKGINLQEYEIRIFDALGRQHAVEMKSNSIIVDHFTEGVFWVVLESKASQKRIRKPFMVVN